MAITCDICGQDGGVHVLECFKKFPGETEHMGTIEFDSCVDCFQELLARIRRLLEDGQGNGCFPGSQ